MIDNDINNTAPEARWGGGESLCFRNVCLRFPALQTGLTLWRTFGAECSPTGWRLIFGALHLVSAEERHWHLHTTLASFAVEMWGISIAEIGNAVIG